MEFNVFGSTVPPYKELPLDLDRVLPSAHNGVRQMVNQATHSLSGKPVAFEV